MMIAAHQIHYLPWLRYVDKIVQSDLFVILDDVQFTINGWQNRTRIKGATGAFYLTVPVRHPFGILLSATEIADDATWRRKHQRALQINYARSAWYKAYGPAIEQHYEHPWRLLADVSWALLDTLLQALNISTPLVRASTLGIGGFGPHRLAAICQSLGADTYLTGAFAAVNHLDLAPFREAGIRVVVQDWQCPPYRQCYAGSGFLPDLSIVDLLFNEGAHSRDILRTGSTLRPLEHAGVRP